MLVSAALNATVPVFGHLITDPVETVRADVALLRDAPELAGRHEVSGHVYDVATGRVATVADARYA